MTREDFRAWYAKHRAAFPGVDSWLNKFARQPVEGGALSQREILDQWFDCLKHESLDDCIAATYALNSGERDAPRAFDDHARTVRRIAFEIRNARSSEKRLQVYGGEPSYRCLQCRDEGLVMVWHPDAMKLAAESGELPRKRYEAAVRCDCEAGSSRNRPEPQYDANRWLLIDRRKTTQENIADLIDFMADYRDRAVLSMPNYEPSFAEF